jgi:pimeloyl-ACP methyl ester carboxylesterase
LVKSDSYTIDTQGARIVGQVEGDGDPVVLLHGFADDRRSWGGIAGELSRDRRVVRYDLRGYGESVESGQVRFRHARDLLLVLDTLNIPQSDLIGVSMGGAIAVNFALDFPGRVRRLILISPGLVGWQWSELWRSRWAKIREVATQSLADARELWWSHPLFATLRAHPAAAEILHRDISQYSGKHWLHDNEERALPDLDRLHALRVPTMLITGQHDVEDFRLIAGMIAATAPDVLRVDIENAGHLPQLECPVEVLGRINGFLRGSLSD